MANVTVSPKFQVVIPKEVRKDIKPGMKLAVFRYGGHIVYVPVPSLEKVQGMLKGMDTTLDRSDFDREL